MKPFDFLEPWLSEHSVRRESLGSEIVFTHASGEKSILLSREVQSSPTVKIEVDSLASFYDDYSGASIGNSQIIIGTNVLGGIQISRGYRLPDLNQMRSKAREINISVGENEQVFMAEAAWMFVYTVTGNGADTRFRKYDRDYGTNRIIEDPKKVLDSWWNIVLEDQL